MKTMTVKIQRLIPAPVDKVFKGWLNPKFPGNPWSDASKLIFNPKVNGMFYWYISKTPHYGRFTKVKHSSEIQHTWMSPYTSGLESVVKVTFKKKGKDTLMTLTHTKLPNNADGKGHEEGWGYFLDKLAKYFKRKQ